MYKNKIILGTANLSNGYGLENKKFKNHNDLKRIFKYIKRNNKKVFIDTAQAYGKSEKVLGRVFDKKKVEYITKIILKKNDINLNRLNQKIVNSLKNLKTNKIYCLLIHNTNFFKNDKTLNKIRNYLIKLKKEKIIKKYGVSIYDMKDLKKIYKKFDPDVVQLPLNIFDQNKIKSLWIKKMFDQKKEIHIRSIFLQGVLLKKRNQLPKYFIKFKNHFEKWHNWLIDNDMSNLNACLKFIYNEKHVSKFVVGVENYDQFKKIINYKNDKKRLFFKALASKNKKLIDPRKW